MSYLLRRKSWKWPCLPLHISISVRYRTCCPCCIFAPLRNTPWSVGCVCELLNSFAYLLSSFCCCRHKESYGSRNQHSPKPGITRNPDPWGWIEFLSALLEPFCNCQHYLVVFLLRILRFLWSWGFKGSLFTLWTHQMHRTKDQIHSKIIESSSLGSHQHTRPAYLPI